MNSIQNRCDILNAEIDELKKEILGDFVVNEEEDNIDNLIHIAISLGAAYVHRDNIVTPKEK